MHSDLGNPFNLNTHLRLLTRNKPFDSFMPRDLVILSKQGQSG